ncbi:endonuclease/exonuclease/phosphatase family protein [Olleya aquimaris]|uniref:Endonuclease/exonuclease/phosphatase (EEP) superfamily protein YafD n=1 Tax=Olleya aquimaris TaxID=639310 RepID=A0A327RBV1_9FLAO|nr:endonuclease/exonuclease/phosphatase family protein [Olleya aquimaris]RAJ12953.1 endonuclease/exonuclease/phosphatase (EEP) superfamily protein YafD [Olleya aquimaris]
MKIKKLLQTLGLITVILTLLPTLDLDYWFIRMLDFPHIQLTILTLVSALLLLIKFDVKDFRDYAFVVILIGCFCFQAYKIIPYTPLVKTELKDYTKTSQDSITLFTANLLQKNKNPTKVIQAIQSIQADVVVLTEANKRWKNDLSSVINSLYPFKVEIALPNTYGMLFYSKHKLINPEIKYLINDSIPSIHTKLQLPNQSIVQFYAIHPTPPMPQENPMSTERDAELMLVAKMARNSEIPVIVLGDLNDVAWSETSNLFKKISGLLDARVGRGFYNTYNAKNYILRWPLDHIFVSEEFRYRNKRVCDAIESDHFPLFMSLSFEPNLASEQKKKPPTTTEIEEANKHLEKHLNK